MDTFLVRLIFYKGTLDCLTTHFNIQSELMAAFILAIGFAIPELTTNTLSSFGKSREMMNYGFGVVIGSGIFSLISYLFSDFTLCFGIGTIASYYIHGKALKYEVYPLLRDYGFYILSLSFVIYITQGRIVRLWESIALIFLFPLYLIFSFYYEGKKIELEYSDNTYSGGSMEAKADIEDRESFIIDDDQLSKDIDKLNQDLDILNKDMSSFYNDIYQKENVDGLPIPNSFRNLDLDYNELEMMSYSETKLYQVFRIFNAPWRFLFRFTLHPESYPKLSFALILLYVTLIIEVSVRYVEIISKKIQISHAFIGLTITALGANILDIVNFIVASKAKRIELATTSLIGSQIVNLHLSLGLPWVAKIWYSGEFELTELAIEASLLVSLAITVMSLLIIAIFRFKLTLGSGYLLILLYFLYFGIQLNELVLKPMKTNLKKNNENK